MPKVPLFSLRFGFVFDLAAQNGSATLDLNQFRQAPNRFAFEVVGRASVSLGGFDLLRGRLLGPHRRILLNCTFEL